MDKAGCRAIEGLSYCGAKMVRWGQTWPIFIESICRTQWQEVAQEHRCQTERFGGLVLAVLCEPNSMSLDKSLHLSLVSQSLHSKNGNESLVPHTHKLMSA